MQSYQNKALILLTVILATVLSKGYSHIECISSYSELEESLLKNKYNVDQIIDTFFPVNRQQSTVVDVTYFCRIAMKL